MGVGAIFLFILNRNTPVPASWGAAGGERDNPTDIFNVTMQAVGLALTSAIFGALVLGRKPRHRVGWFLMATGLASAVTPLFGEWTIYGHYTVGEAIPALGLVSWITNWAWIPLFGSVLWMLAIFPDGQMLSARWRLVAGGPIVVFTVCMFVGAAIETPAMSSAFQAPNPFFSNTPVALYNILFNTGSAAMAISMIAVLVAVLARFRQAPGRERQQVKWLMAGVALMALMALSGLLLSLIFGIALGDILVNSSYMAALLGIGTAMLRHQLYDIDVIIRRTLIYSVLTALLAVVYFSSVVVLQSVVTTVSGQPSSLTIVISTLAIAVLFSPLRRWVQEAIDRRFFRSKYDAEQMLSQFAEAARGETELARLGQALLTVVKETMQPEQAWLWLRDEGDQVDAAMADGSRSLHRSSLS